jgi:hypothetical protein
MEDAYEAFRFLSFYSRISSIAHAAVTASALTLVFPSDLVPLCGSLHHLVIRLEPTVWLVRGQRKVAETERTPSSTKNPGGLTG